MRILWSPPYFSYLVPTWCSSFLQFFFSAKHVKRRDCFFFGGGGLFKKPVWGHRLWLGKVDSLSSQKFSLKHFHPRIRGSKHLLQVKLCAQHRNMFFPILACSIIRPHVPLNNHPLYNHQVLKPFQPNRQLIANPAEAIMVCFRGCSVPYGQPGWKSHLPAGFLVFQPF